MIIVKFRLAGIILKNNNNNKKNPIASYKLTYTKNIRKLSPLTFLLVNEYSNQIRECLISVPL